MIATTARSLPPARSAHGLFFENTTESDFFLREKRRRVFFFLLQTKSRASGSYKARLGGRPGPQPASARGSQR